MPEAARTRTFRSWTACLVARLRSEKTIEVAHEQAAWELAAGGRRPAAGAKLPQASSISSVHSPIEFGLSFTFYPTKSNPIESKAIGCPYPIRSKSIRIQVKKSNWIWIKPNPFPGLYMSGICTNIIHLSS